jgi:hypothetical protein
MNASVYQHGATAADDPVLVVHCWQMHSLTSGCVLLRLQVAMINALGAGFDCASVQELKCAAAHDVPQDRVIFANPCKRPADFR